MNGTKNQLTGYFSLQLTGLMIWTAHVYGDILGGDGQQDHAETSGLSKGEMPIRRL